MPVLPEDNSITSIKDSYNSNRLEETNELSAFAHKPKPERKRKGKDKAKRRKLQRENALRNATSPIIYEFPRLKQGRQRINRRRRNKSKEVKAGDTSIENIKWKTYYSEAASPLHPKAIVEEFVYTPH